MSSNKPSVLLVLPVGMAVRNFVLNRTVWNYLTSNYNVDVVTPVQIDDPAAMGIRKVFDTGRVRGIRRYIRAINHRFLHRLQMMGMVQFYLRGDDPNTLQDQFATLKGQGLDGSMLRWSSLSGSRLEPFVRRLLTALVRFHPVHRFKKRDYDLVVLAHSFAPEAVAYGLICERLRIPVVCTALGHDHLMYPLAFTPDLLFVWGPEDARAFDRSHRARNSRFEKTTCITVGNLVNDFYSETSESASAVPTILLPVPGIFSPHHLATTERVIKILNEKNIAARLLIRLRPGVDLSHWQNLARKNPERVELQSNSSAAFDTTNVRQIFNLEEEAGSARLYAQTLRDSALILSMGFSTVVIEGMALGTPAIVIPRNIIDADPEPSRTDWWLVWHMSQSLHHPGRRQLKIAETRDDLDRMLLEALSPEQRNDYLASGLVESTSLAAGKSSGARWVSAVTELINGGPSAESKSRVN